MHSYNHGLVTSSKGCAIEFVKVTGLNVATPSGLCTVDDGKSNLINTITHTATGTYVIQLKLPYPPSLVGFQASMSNANGTTDIRVPCLKSASYSATTGQLTVLVMDDDDSGAPVLADGGATDEMYLVLVFRRYTT